VIPALLSRFYGIASSAREVRLLPGGYHASAHVVDSSYVVKFYDTEPSLDVVAFLKAAGLPVAAPIPSLSGSLSPALPDGRFVAVFPFIRGGTPDGWPVWSPSVLRSLGALLRNLHSLLRVPPAASAPAPHDLVWIRRVDGLEVPFEATLTGLLRRPDVPYREEFAEQLSRLHALRTAALARPAEPVVCHTDVGGDNILLTPSGELVLLDWDEAVLGPPENDFILLARDEPPGSRVLDTVLDGYGAALDPVRLAYCQLRRYLADACVRLERLADPACPDPAAAEADLVAWGVRPWRALADPH
jgi:Ser/Thr protein kinase RdoA (MazF antagonist)